MPVKTIRSASKCFMCGTLLTQVMYYCEQCRVAVCSQECLLAHQVEMGMVPKTEVKQ